MDAQEILMKILGALWGFVQVIYWYLEALYRQFIPPEMKSINSETILVTGASGGIGKGICRHLVKSGTNMKLILWDLNQADLDKLAEELKSSNSTVTVFPMAVDISSKDTIDAACKEVKDKVGSVSIVFNNAGIACMGNFLQLTDEQIEKTMQVNLMSNLWIIRQFLGDMVLKNHGRIINTCSMGGLKAAQHALPYFTSKFGVNGLTDALKVELEQFENTGIHCTTVYPYFVQTPLIKTLSLHEQNKSQLPSAFRKFMDANDVGRRIVDGMRREYEYIYLPSIIPVILFLEYLAPMKLRKTLVGPMITGFTFKNPEEDKRINMTYLETVKSRKLIE